MIRWGILGVGNIAQRFMKSLKNSEKGYLYAVASYTGSKLDDLKKEYPELIIYHSYDDILKDPDIDVVYLAMRHIDHYQWAIKALENHKAVLCEKPAVLYSWQMNELKAKSIENQTFFMEAMKTRFIPLIDDIHEYLKNKDIGEVVCVKTSFCYQRGYTKGHYLFDNGQGGILNDVGSYHVASILDYINDKVALIESKVWYRYNVDCHNKVWLTFENGQKAYMEMAFDERKAPILEIIGTKARIEAEPFYRPIHAKIVMNNGKRYELEKPYVHDDFYGEIEEVHRCLSKGLIESPRMSLQDSVNCIELIEKIRESFKK